MHTIFLALDAGRLCRLVDLGSDLARQDDFNARIRSIRDEARQEFYRHSRWSDTLSFLTEYLTGNFECDLTVDLGHVFEDYFEAGFMTIGCEAFLHAKYLDPEGLEILERSLADRPRVRLGYRRMRNLLGMLHAAGSVLPSQPKPA